jgi:uncharacterized protein (DUF1697 family)
MTRRIAILRGINVGGRRKILMADLKKLLNDLGFESVQTYIQSGNVIFEAKDKESNHALASQIEKAISNIFGYDVPVIVRNADQMNKSIQNNPFLKSDQVDIDRLHLTFLKEIPRNDNLVKINTYDFQPDKFEVIGDDVFLYCAGKSSDSKLTNAFFENKLKVTATTRNWKTVLALSELIK